MDRSAAAAWFRYRKSKDARVRIAGKLKELREKGTYEGYQYSLFSDAKK